MEEEWRFGTGGLCDGNSTRDCELALPLQSGRWMTNEVCLFHSLSSSSLLPPPHPTPSSPFTLLLSVRVEKEKGSSCGSA